MADKEQKKKEQREPNRMELIEMTKKVKPGSAKYFPQFDITIHRPKTGVDKDGDKKFKFIKK